MRTAGCLLPGRRVMAARRSAPDAVGTRKGRKEKEGRGSDERDKKIQRLLYPHTFDGVRVYLRLL